MDLYKIFMKFAEEDSKDLYVLPLQRFCDLSKSKNIFNKRSIENYFETGRREGFVLSIQELFVGWTNVKIVLEDR